MPSWRRGSSSRASQRVNHAVAENRYAWVQVARGAVEVNGQKLVAGDGLAAQGAGELAITGVEAAEVLVFDLA